jgi:hypothetical protein
MDMMDEEEARQALRTADSLAAKMRGQGRWYPSVVAALGLVEAANVLLGGLTSSGGPSWLVPVALIPVFTLIVYTATRPVLALRQRVAYPVLGALSGALVAIAIPLGIVRFVGNPAWWVPAALIAAVPYLLISWFEVRGRRR